MLTKEEFFQMSVAVKHMSSPMCKGNEETVWKSGVMELIKTFTEEEENGSR